MKINLLEFWETWNLHQPTQVNQDPWKWHQTRHVYLIHIPNYSTWTSRICLLSNNSAGTPKPLAIASFWLFIKIIVMIPHHLVHLRQRRYNEWKKKIWPKFLQPYSSVINYFSVVSLRSGFSTSHNNRTAIIFSVTLFSFLYPLPRLAERSEA